MVFVPGDNENDARDFLRYFHLVNDVDIIIPFVMNIEVRSKFRRIVSSIYRLIINITFGMNLNYTNGNVIYNRKIYNLKYIIYNLKYIIKMEKKLTLLKLKGYIMRMENVL